MTPLLDLLHPSLKLVRWGIVKNRYSDYKSSGNDGGLLLYRLAAELDLKRLDMERTVPADLNSFVNCGA